MQSTVTIPEAVNAQSIVEFRMRPGSKDVVVILLDNGERQATSFNIQDMLDTISGANKNVIRTWYKNLATLAIEAYNDQSASVATPIDGEVFDDV